MKHYFKFKLNGDSLIGVWLLILFFVFLPYIGFTFMTRVLPRGDSRILWAFPCLFIVLILALVFTYYFVKLTIANIEYKENRVVFGGKFSTYVGKIMLGLFLSIITVGVYIPWFIRNINRFFINNTYYKTRNFEFKGEGVNLFVIILLTLFIPLMFIIIGLAIIIIRDKENVETYMLIYQLALPLIMTPYYYLFYKWIVNIKFDDYHIQWDTRFWSSCGKLALEITLSVITIGIYFPLAAVRLYKYFVMRTIAIKKEQRFPFDYDIEPGKDFLFIWGQMLLTIITLGIYYPWAYCKITERILGKTSFTTDTPAQIVNYE
jgi:uncharacterized membrane protein YjgN (DUF898 family)